MLLRMAYLLLATGYVWVTMKHSICCTFSYKQQVSENSARNAFKQLKYIEENERYLQQKPTKFWTDKSLAPKIAISWEQVFK